MVRTTHGRPRLGATSLLSVLVVMGLVLAGCAGNRVAATGGCDPCDAPARIARATPTADPGGGCPPAELGAEAGQAWCRVWIPPEYAMVAETYCVKPATQRTVQIPAEYGVRPKLVCVQEAKMGERCVSAEYGVKKRQVMVCPPREEWKRICCERDPELEGHTIQTQCWQKVVHPARYEEEDCPVCLSPERRCVEYTPAEYCVMEERYLVSPARCQCIPVPPVFDTRMKEVCVRPGRWEWRRNDACEVPCAPAVAPAPCAPAGN